MSEPLTAFIDMEFAGIYGTHQRMQIPIEIGVAFHDPETDAVSFAGKAFARDIDVELWKNVTDDVGKRVDGNRRVFNLLRPGISLEFNRKYHLDQEGIKKARSAVAGVHADLRGFMQTLNRHTIKTLVFFAQRREIEAFHHARINTGGFEIRDLQSEIKKEYSLKEDVSLDRMSITIGFMIRNTAISSNNFTYSIPEKYRYIIKPHKAIGDAARMLLVSREFSMCRQEFGERVLKHVNEYEARKIMPKATENA